MDKHVQQFYGCVFLQATSNKGLQTLRKADADLARRRSRRIARPTASCRVGRAGMFGVIWQYGQGNQQLAMQALARSTHMKSSWCSSPMATPMKVAHAGKF
mmetsp:Transcript_123217/g.245327  ORF Transcript_123217/g.245327 Transcript_123217/m.245327 type:complete len:101 (+) Transcript_123217:81-383(+)